MGIAVDINGGSRCDEDDITRLGSGVCTPEWVMFVLCDVVS